MEKMKKTDRIDRHKQLMQEYLKQKTEPKKYMPANYKTERDIIRENHKFVRTEADEEETTWEQRVAKKYYDKLFKEYALCELKYFKEGKIALRWRTEKEVVVGKGQFICASTRCDATAKLHSWEVNFGYIEDGEKKNELVKVRLCQDCSDKLNYKTKKRLAKKRKEVDDTRNDQKAKKFKNGIESQSSDDDQTPAQDTESSIWRKPLESKEEKTKEEEYEDYFSDLLQ